MDLQLTHFHEADIHQLCATLAAGAQDPSLLPALIEHLQDELVRRVRAEAALRAREAHLRLAMDAAHMGTWERDLRTGLDYWSEQEESLFGVARGQFARTHQAFLDIVLPEDRPALAEAERRALEEREPYRSEFRIRLADGTIRWMAGRGDVVRGADGRPERLVGVTMDITALKQAELERAELLERERAAHTEARQANEAKDRFLAVLSHELRTPLTPVTMAADMLARQADLPESVRPVIAMMQRNVELEARLIDDLLDITRVISGKLELHPACVDLHAVLGHVVEMFAQEVRSKGLALEVQLEARVHVVRADSARLHQVAWNLVRNALKFTPQGSITIRTENPEPNRVRLTVRDTGVGIRAEALPRIFDAFEQGGREVTQRFGGLGLGLAISRAIVEMHGGSIRAASAGPGTGASFTVELAVLEAAANGVEAASLGGTLRCRVLLVEDHPDTRRMVVRLLESFGCQVDSAATAAEALALAGQQHYDLVVSDIGLPEVSGLDLMRQLKAAHGLRGVALSGYGMDEDLQRSRQAGFEAHLIKPVSLESLQETVFRLLVDANAAAGQRDEAPSAGKPTAGVEPATTGLQNRCSAIELHRRG